MKYVVGIPMVLLAFLLISCGDDDDSPSEPASATQSPSDSGNGDAQPTEAPDTDAQPGSGATAAEGEMIIEVDGRTFTGSVTECTIDENNFIVQARDESSGASMDARVFDAGAGWTVGATARQGDVSYAASSSDNVEPTIDGRTLTLTVDFGDANLADVGPGRISATCAE